MTNHTRLLLLIALGACGPDVPAEPTYFADVAPILRANCVRCHGADPVDPKVASFRLDRNVPGDEDPMRFDVWDYATGDAPPILRVAVNHEAPVMPPDYALTDRQRELLGRWIDNGAKRGTRDNHAPELVVVSTLDTTTADQAFDVAIRTTDADLDGLAVQLWYRDLTDPSASDRPIGPLVGGGDRAFTLDTGTLASQHTFALYAVVDDGFDPDPANNRTELPVIPELRIDHGARGTAPVVQLLSPNGGETLIETATITWTANDPDVGDALTYDLALMRMGQDGAATDVEATIATGLRDLASLSYTWTIPPSIPAGTPFKIRVTASDSQGIPLGQPPNVRSDDSDSPVYVAQPATTAYGWADVRPIFESYCSACHAAAGKTPAIDYFCMLKYNTADADPACEASDDGVFETKGLVYQRMVTARSMPPQAEPQPQQAELDIVANWILGGAPKDTGGMTDATPMLQWTAPGANVLDGSSAQVASLAWTIEDTEGLASDALEYVKLMGSNCAVSSCPPTNGGAWISITGAGGAASGTTQLRTFDWAAPSTGCFCVRGTVTDTAGQRTTVTATKPVKF